MDTEAISEGCFFNYRTRCPYIDVDGVPYFCSHENNGNATCDYVKNCPLTIEDFKHLCGLK
jgi:hypothetical protein